MTDSDSEEEMEVPVIKVRSSAQNKPLNASTGSGLPPPNIGPSKRPTAPPAITRISHIAPKIQKSISENVHSFPTATGSGSSNKTAGNTDHSIEVCFQKFIQICI